MTALYGFLVGFTTSRPLRPDEEVTYVAVLGEDSPSGFLEARWVAVAMASGIRRAQMVTSTELVHVEL